jgi:small subunit ribosomal protein S12
MATINQLVRNPRVQKVKACMIKALGGAPFKRGTCLKVLTTKPKKPNSAIRKIAKVLLTNRRRITAAVPGIGHSLQEHASVLVRSGRANDLPGVRFKLVRGKLDFSMPETNTRNRKRSKYGVKKSS